MSIELQTDSGVTANITGELALDEFIATYDGLVLARLDLSVLNTAGPAVFEPVLRRKDSGGTVIGEFPFAEAKRTDATATYTAEWIAIYLNTGEKAELLVKSSNANDTGVSWASAWADPNEARNVDGITDLSLREMTLAFLAGKTSLVDNGDGTKTLSFKKQDGSTVKFTVKFDASGQHTAITIDP